MLKGTVDNITGLDLRKRIQELGWSNEKAAQYCKISENNMTYIKSMGVITSTFVERIYCLFDVELPIPEKKCTKRSLEWEKKRKKSKKRNTELLINNWATKISESKVAMQDAESIRGRMNTFPSEWMPDINALLIRLDAAAKNIS
jgi:hypothetical protein